MEKEKVGSKDSKLQASFKVLEAARQLDGERDTELEQVMPSLHEKAGLVLELQQAIFERETERW